MDFKVITLIMCQVWRYSIFLDNLKYSNLFFLIEVFPFDEKHLQLLLELHNFNLCTWVFPFNLVVNSDRPPPPKKKGLWQIWDAGLITKYSVGFIYLFIYFTDDKNHCSNWKNRGIKVHYLVTLLLLHLSLLSLFLCKMVNI